MEQRYVKMYINFFAFAFVVIFVSVLIMCNILGIEFKHTPPKAPTIISKTHQEAETTKYGYKPSLYILQIEKEDGSKENIFVSELDYSLAIIGEEYDGD